MTQYSLKMIHDGRSHIYTLGGYTETSYPNENEYVIKTTFSIDPYGVPCAYPIKHCQQVTLHYKELAYQLACSVRLDSMTCSYKRDIPICVSESTSKAFYGHPSEASEYYYSLLPDLDDNYSCEIPLLDKHLEFIDSYKFSPYLVDDEVYFEVRFNRFSRVDYLNKDLLHKAYH